jgi:glycosyltransferase involved in cell wall biosynthesis
MPAAEHERMTETNQTLDIDIVVPCYNEQDTLAAHVRRLHTFCRTSLHHSWRITIADNASTDDTARIADDLAAMLPDVHAVHLPQKGRGRALKAVWGASPATVLVYVDEDLSTDLAALEPLVAPLLSGHPDVAIGTRLADSARVVRGGKREFISRSYNLLLRTTMGGLVLRCAARVQGDHPPGCRARAAALRGRRWPDLFEFTTRR